MKCPVCKKWGVFNRIGATVGGSQLIACPHCGVVLCEQAIEK